MNQIRSQALEGFFEVARMLELSPYRMLARVGIQPAWIHEIDRPISTRAVDSLLIDMARASGCDSVGLLLAKHRNLRGLGPLVLLLEHLDTLRDAVREIIRNQKIVGEILSLSLVEQSDLSIIKIHLDPRVVSYHSVDMTVFTIFRAMKDLSRGHWSPVSINLMRARPKNPRIWQEYYGINVDFESDLNAISCDNASLDEPNPLADKTLALHARRLIQMISKSSDIQSIAERSARTIARLLPEGNVTAGRVGKDLGVSARTMQRSLARERRTFASVLSEVRRDLAQRYLHDSALTITDTAHLLGYSNLSSFTRWFSIEFGMPPQAWRRSAAMRSTA